tara:strand:- start:348 stop:1259 length:912 start_codon:yes stop_codon:yes gene_type:complete
MKALIIGYGSIGKKHAEILYRNKKIKKIYVFSKQPIPKKFNTCKNYKSILSINPDYIIISTATSKHIKNLKIIDQNLKNKIILVEKPLFERNYIFRSKNNHIYVGYNLRYHPVLKKVKSIIKNKKVYSVHAECLSNLINWRKGRDYKKTSSAKKNAGGGVILDLSHEFDYISWIFNGELKPIFSIFNKLSNLKIETEDFLSLTAKIKNKIIVNILLKYYSLISYRKIIIFGKNFTINADLLKNKIILVNKNKEKKYYFKNFSINQSYENMHQAILSKNFSDLCTLENGIKTMKFIDKLKGIRK